MQAVSKVIDVTSFSQRRVGGVWGAISVWHPSTSLDNLPFWIRILNCPSPGKSPFISTSPSIP